MNIAKKLILPLVALLSAGYAAPKAPDETPDGLVRVKKSKAELVYVRPGVDLAAYTKVVLVEPTIAFRKNWKSDTNFKQPTNRVSDQDMANMITKGKELLIEEFAAELTKGGYPVASAPAAGVLAVKPAIVDLDVYAPDPDGTAGLSSKTYSDGSGEAILQLELFDSVTGQLLVRAFDQKSSADNSYTWRVQRTRVTNEADARFALNGWAQMLVEGLNRAKAAAKAP